MSLISLSKVQNVLPEFIDTRLIPSAPSHVKWVLGGATFVILRKVDNIVNDYTPLLRKFDLINDNNQLDIELTRSFINYAFTKCDTVELFGFKFNCQDGDALIGILEKYKDV